MSFFLNKIARRPNSSAAKRVVRPAAAGHLQQDDDECVQVVAGPLHFVHQESFNRRHPERLSKSERSDRAALRSHEHDRDHPHGQQRVRGPQSLDSALTRYIYA